MAGLQAQITFLYYQQIEPAASFYQHLMGFELVEDQGWARIYRTSGNAYLGIVAGEKGFHTPQENSAVLVTLVVDDAVRWYGQLKDRGVNMLSDPSTGRDWDTVFLPKGSGWVHAGGAAIPGHSSPRSLQRPDRRAC